MSTTLSARNKKSSRVAPVAEMFDHIGHQNKLLRTLADAGNLNHFYELAQGYFQRGVARRLVESKRLSNCPKPELEVRAAAGGRKPAIFAALVDRSWRQGFAARNGYTLSPDGVERECRGDPRRDPSLPVANSAPRVQKVTTHD